MTRRCRLVALVFALPLLFIYAAGQVVTKYPQRPEDKPQMTVRVTTRLVEVNVVVHDKKGQPVTGLTKDDFVLLDDGKPRTISVFDVEVTEPAPPNARVLPPNTYTNGFGTQAPVKTPSLTVILFDTLNTKWQDQVYARAQMLKFLKQLQPQDRVAILQLGNGLKVLHDFSGDMESLVRAVERYQARINIEVDASTGEVSDSGNEELDAILEQANTQMANFYLERRVQTTLKALQDVSNYLSSFPGRKNLLWVSGAFPFSYGLEMMMSPTPGATRMPDVKLFNSDYGRAAQAVNNGNVAIYPVDARGLVGIEAIMPSMSASSPSMSAAARGRVDSRASIQFMQTLETMKDLAERTGGRAFYNTNDIMGSLRQAIDDSRVTYVLGFYPKEEDWAGKFHKLKVQVKRPGVNVRARQGFYALPDAPPPAARQRERLMGDALRAPLETTSIGLTVHLEPGAAPKQPMRFQIIVDPRQLRLAREGGRYVGTLTLAFLQRAVNGAEFGTKGDEISLNITEENYRRMMADGMAISGEWVMQPGAEQLRIVVCDNASTKLGTISVPLPVPPSAKKKRAAKS